MGERLGGRRLTVGWDRLWYGTLRVRRGMGVPPMPGAGGSEAKRENGPAEPVGVSRGGDQRRSQG